MSRKYIVILIFLLSFGAQEGILWAQDAKLLKRADFMSVQMKEGNDKSIVAGSVDVYYWSTYEGGESDGNRQVVASNSKINVSFTNFQWEKLRWGLGRTQLVFQGSRFSRENPSFNLEKISNANQLVETDQSVFLPIATPSEPGKMEFIISPKLSSACANSITLKLKLYAIKRSGGDEAGALDKVTANDILIEIPFKVLPPKEEDEAAWQKVLALKEDIFEQTAAIQQYQANFGECGKYASQAVQYISANEAKVCQNLDKQSAESYLKLYQTLGWSGNCADEAQSMTGELKKEDFYQKALNTRRLSTICQYLNTYNRDPALAQQKQKVRDHLNRLVTARWRRYFGDERPEAEEDQTDCQRFINYLDRCPERVMDRYLNKYNLGKRWLARVCVRSADECESLWKSIQEQEPGEDLTRLQREYCDVCSQMNESERYWEVLREVKPKIVTLSESPTPTGTQMYSYQLSYVATPLQWVRAKQEQDGTIIQLDTLSQLQILYEDDSLITEKGKIILHFSAPDIIDIIMPEGLQGIFEFELADSLGKEISLSINTSLKPLYAEILSGNLEEEYRIKISIQGGDSLQANGKCGYRMILRNLDEPEISLPISFQDRPTDDTGAFTIDKETDLKSLPDGSYEIVIRDGRNDETHEVRPGQIIQIKHRGRIPSGMLKAGLSVILLLMVSWLSYANIRVARKAKKK